MIIYNRSGEQIADVVISDDAQRYQELGGDDYITLRFDLAEYVNIPLYAYIVYDGIQYTIYEEPNIKKFNNTHYEYTIRMLAPQGVLTLRRLRNSVDYRLEFPFTGTASEHLSMILASIRGWGGLTSDPSNTTKTINYSYNTVYEAIQMVASAFNLGLEFDNANKMVYLGEHSRSTYIELSYGSGNGLLPGIIRKSYNGLSPIGLVYAQGGSRNIDASVYGSSKLLLPKNAVIYYDGKCFEGETDYDADNSQVYLSDATGHSVSRLNLLETIAEGVLDCTEIYPHRESTISSVKVYNDKYFIADNTIPSTLNYADYLIAGGGNMTIVFQSGELAGREFEVKYYHNASGSLPARRFEIIAQDIDGITMPGESFVPAEGDRYAVFNVALPDAYIADDTTKTGASWDMFKKCVRYLHENSQVQYTIDGEIQPGWSERQWSSIKSKVVVGGYVRFTDVALAPSGIYLRISTIKHSLNKPYAPKLGFASNAIKRSSVRTSIDRLSADVSALQVANYRTSQSSRVSAQILGDRIDDIEGNTGGGGSLNSVDIATDAPEYLDVSSENNNGDVTLHIKPKTPTIASGTSGLATTSTVREWTNNNFLSTESGGYPKTNNTGYIGSATNQWKEVRAKSLYENGVELPDKYMPKNALSVEPSEHNFTWRVATGDSKLTDSLAVVNKLLGRTVKWHQLINKCDSVTDMAEEVQVKYDTSSNEIVINNTSPKSSDYSQTTIFGAVSEKALVAGHKYLICADRAHLGVGITEGTYYTSFRHVNSVFSANYNIVPRFAISSSYDFSAEHSYPTDGSAVGQNEVRMKLNLFDLTEMFGSGNEPKSLGEFRKLYPKAYYEPFITSRIVGVDIAALPSASYNLWNKNEAVQGAIMYGNGWLRSDAYYKNWWTYIIPVAPNTRYYLLNVANRSQCMPCVYYDADMKHIGHDGPQSLDTSTGYVSGEVLTPANAAYMAVMVKNAYKDTACVSVSSRRNGDYEAYIASGTPLTLEDADGNKLFPYGLLATADGVADEIGEGYALQRVAYDTAADGTISNLRQVEIVNSAGNTVKGFYYSPINTRLWMTWRVRRGATEKVTLSDISAPFRASISYALDVNDLLPAPLLEDVGGGTILTYNDLTRTPSRSTKTISQNWYSIQSADKNRIPTGEDVYLAIQRLRPAAIAPAMPIEAVNTMNGATLIANVVSILNGTSTVCYIKELVASVSTDGSIYNDVWILRAAIRQGTTFRSDVKINWKNNQQPTFTATSAVYEIKIQKMPNLGYIGEWSAYYIS